MVTFTGAERARFEFWFEETKSLKGTTTHHLKVKSVFIKFSASVAWSSRVEGGGGFFHTKS